MGIENYNIQKDLYRLLQSNESDIMMKSDNGEFHIVFIESPSETLYYPFNCKFSMEKDYESLLKIINKLRRVYHG